MKGWDTHNQTHGIVNDGDCLASKNFEPFERVMTGRGCINQKLTLVGQ